MIGMFVRFLLSGLKEIFNDLKDTVDLIKTDFTELKDRLENNPESISSDERKGCFFLFFFGSMLLCTICIIVVLILSNFGLNLALVSLN